MASPRGQPAHTYRRCPYCGTPRFQCGRAPDVHLLDEHATQTGAILHNSFLLPTPIFLTPGSLLLNPQDPQVAALLQAFEGTFFVLGGHDDIVAFSLHRLGQVPSDDAVGGDDAAEWRDGVGVEG